MKHVIHISLVLAIILSCRTQNLQFFDINHFKKRLSNDYNIELDNSLETMHNLSDAQVDSIEKDVGIASDFTILSNLFYQDLEPQISNSEIKFRDASQYLSESFSKSILKQNFERGDIIKEDYTAVDSYIDFIADEDFGSPIHQGWMFHINIDFMKNMGLLTDTEYRELILVNYILMIIDYKNG